ncbi:MAG: DUF935 domain-containing protein [Gammaproteobacteria bacterium]|nr:DUF935 domain-containing protein [Gammaproteobacteria bacterium]
MAILDHRGNPIKSSALTKETAGPTLSGVRTQWYESVATGLTPERLAAVLVAVDDGNDIGEYLTLAEEMEMRDLHYSAVLSTRKNAVSGLDIMIEAASDSAEDVKIRDAVAEMFDDDPMTNLVRDMMDAVGKSFSVDEIMWDRSGPQWFPLQYKWRDPRYFQFDMKYREEIRLRDDSNPAEGLPLEPYKFIYHLPHIKTGLPIRGGLARLAVIAYMCKGYTLKDWLAFAEVFGMPLRLGKYGSGATDAQKASLLSAVASIGTDAAAIIHEDMIIEFIAAEKTAGGEKLFEGLADWLDSQTSKGVLGQTMTADDGASMSQAQVHNEVRGDIKVEDAKQVSATLRRDLVKPFVDLNFGPRKRGQYPKLRLVTDEPEDLESLSKSLPVFIDRGLRVEASVIRDKFRLPKPEDDAEVLKPKGGASPLAEPGDDDTEPEPDDIEGDGDDVDPDDDQAMQREQRKAAVQLMRRVRKGKTLTGDQRALLATVLAADKPGHTGDEIDNLTDAELKEWRRLMDPVLQPVLDHANASAGYTEFLHGLDGVLSSMDSTLLAERLAISTFKARGAGDGSDEI